LSTKVLTSLPRSDRPRTGRLVGLRPTGRDACRDTWPLIRPPLRVFG